MVEAASNDSSSVVDNDVSCMRHYIEVTRHCWAVNVDCVEIRTDMQLQRVLLVQERDN